MTKNTYGTGSFVLMNVGPMCPLPSRACSRRSRGRSPTARVAYALEGAIFVTGAAIQWLRDGLGIIGAAAEIGPLAESCPDTEGVYSSRPSPASAARTGIRTRGARSSASRGGRAARTSPAPSSRRWPTRPATSSRRWSELRGASVVALRADGGASVMDLLLQLQADQLQVPVRARPSRRPRPSAPRTSPDSPRACGARSTRSHRSGSSTVSSSLRRPLRGPTSATRAGSEPSTALAASAGRASGGRRCGRAPRAPVARGRATGAPCGRARARGPRGRAAPTRRRRARRARRPPRRTPCCPR